jgi:hypothetical protein
MAGEGLLGKIAQGAAAAAKVAKPVSKAVRKPAKVPVRITDQEIIDDLASVGLTRDDLIRDYPQVAPPTPSFDKKKGKPYLAKTVTPQAQKVMDLRKRMNADIKRGDYEPYFNVEDRYDANPANYNRPDLTKDIVPSRPETVEKYNELYAGDASRARLNEGYMAAKDDPLASGFYKLGQLEQEFIDELGPVIGPKMFEERIADAMAATTGGADPTSNLLMAQYANYIKQTRNAVVEKRANYMPQLATKAYEMPVPIGGRYASGNINFADKMLGITGEGTGVTAANPKRYDFSSSFLGYTDRPVIDEQMMKMIDPTSPGAPSSNAYGVARNMVSEEAAKAGVTPITMQEVPWAGIKGVEGKPHISNYNESIERTSRLTGLSPAEVVRRGLVRAEMPMYGVAIGAPTAGLLGSIPGQNETQY